VRWGILPSFCGAEYKLNQDKASRPAKRITQRQARTEGPFLLRSRLDVSYLSSQMVRYASAQSEIRPLADLSGLLKTRSLNSVRLLYLGCLKPKPACLPIKECWLGCTRSEANSLHLFRAERPWLRICEHPGTVMRDTELDLGEGPPGRPGEIPGFTSSSGVRPSCRSRELPLLSPLTQIYHRACPDSAELRISFGPMAVYLVAALW
jgi:hypothetical protein